jgi:phospholipid-binding lipoprotein MlaA
VNVLGRLAALALLGVLLCGCTTTSSPEALAANDPYEPTNRGTFHFNAKLDKYVVVPSVGAYFIIVPAWGRNRIHDLLDELSLPVTFANDMMQGETRLGAQTLNRFMVNATRGLGGLFDPATRDRIPNHGSDFGVTLGVWGVGEGPYLVLPLLGPSNPRDATGYVVGYYMDPLHWLHYRQHIWWDGGHEYLSLLDLRAQTYQTVQGVQRSSVDFYSSMRSLYRQLRNNQIRHGRPQTGDLPEF